jgi:hypothetical protein
VWSSRWNEDWQGKLKYWEKTCPSATLSTINPTWHDLGSNAGRRLLTAWAMARPFSQWNTVSDVRPCSLVEVYRYFGESYCLQASWKQNTDNESSMSLRNVGVNFYRSTWKHFSVDVSVHLCIKRTKWPLKGAHISAGSCLKARKGIISYWRFTWSLTWGEKYRAREFESHSLRKISGYKLNYVSELLIADDYMNDRTDLNGTHISFARHT